MSFRSPSLLALSLLLALAGCSESGGDESTSDATTTAAEAPTSASEPAYSKFEDYPGEELLYTDGRDEYRLRVKPVESAWLTELAGRPAPVGSHYLAVYVVATGEQADRGVEEAYLNAFSVGLRFGSGDDCNRDALGARDESMEEICHDMATVVTYLEDVPYEDWGTYGWTESTLGGSPLDAGATVAGVAAFTVPDDFEVTSAIEFCGGGESVLMEWDNCVTVPAPTEERS
jgi:hypothetical protein